jgi:hypothetical protein
MQSQWLYCNYEGCKLQLLDIKLKRRDQQGFCGLCAKFFILEMDHKSKFITKFQIYAMYIYNL